MAKRDRKEYFRKRKADLNLKQFAVTINKDLIDKLGEKLKDENLSKKEWVEQMIKEKIKEN